MREYVGIRFQDGGREHDPGVDCYGLLRMVWRQQFAIDLPAFAGLYDDTVRDHQAIREAIDDHATKLFEPICPEGMDPNQGVAVLLHDCRLPLHVAVYAGIDAGRRMILHTTRERGHSHLADLDSDDLANAAPVFARLR